MAATTPTNEELEPRLSNAQRQSDRAAEKMEHWRKELSASLEKLDVRLVPGIHDELIVDGVTEENHEEVQTLLLGSPPLNEGELLRLTESVSHGAALTLHEARRLLTTVADLKEQSKEWSLHHDFQEASARERIVYLEARLHELEEPGGILRVRRRYVQDLLRLRRARRALSEFLTSIDAALHPKRETP